MTSLFLDSLTIQNFRCFQDFKIEKLARVNLIVGRNGVGKTALLEFVALYTSQNNHLAETLMVGVEGLRNKQLRKFWDAVMLTELEPQVLKALQTVESRVVDLAFVGGKDNPNKRIPMVKLADQSERIPLQQLGNGISRMLGLALGLVNAKDKILLLDELENGLHYSTQPIVWRMIFELAAQLNIQVFATTHSIDCIKGFNQALKENPEVGMLLRLRRRTQTGEVVAIPAKKDKLELFISEQLEVR